MLAVGWFPSQRHDQGNADVLAGFRGHQPRKFCRQDSAHHGTVNVEDVPDVCCESERLLLCVLRLDFLAKGEKQVSQGTQDSAFSSSTCPKRLMMESAGSLTPSTTMPELSLASSRSCRNARSSCEILHRPCPISDAYYRRR